MKEARTFRNLGPVSEMWLRAIGVTTREQLESLGAVEVWRRVQLHGFNASLNLLYALEAAIRDLHWTALPPETKARLKNAAKAIPKE